MSETIDLYDLLNSDEPVYYGDYHLTTEDKYLLMMAIRRTLKDGAKKETQP